MPLTGVLEAGITKLFVEQASNGIESENRQLERLDESEGAIPGLTARPLPVALALLIQLSSHLTEIGQIETVSGVLKLAVGFVIGVTLTVTYGASTEDGLNELTGGSSRVALAFSSLPVENSSKFVIGAQRRTLLVVRTLADTRSPSEAPASLGL